MTVDKPAADLSRRGVIRGAAVGGLAVPLLVACGSDEPTGTATAPTGSGGARIPAADVPVGGGKILAESDGVYVVTQPSEGEFKAFSGICTHQKCPVTEITGGEIVCNCHGSHYSVADGSVVSGPAPASLPELTATVEGDTVVVSG